MLLFKITVNHQCSLTISGDVPSTTFMSFTLALSTVTAHEHCLFRLLSRKRRSASSSVVSTPPMCGDVPSVATAALLVMEEEELFQARTVHHPLFHGNQSLNPLPIKPAFEIIEKIGSDRC